MKLFGVLSWRGMTSRWLRAHASELQSLKFGNHRKYESRKPGDLQDILASFVGWVQKYGRGRLREAFSACDASPEVRFDRLFRRLTAGPYKVVRFGRTGAFDLLNFMADFELVDVRPGSPYIAGATGPRRGARRIWGDRPDRALNALATRQRRSGETQCYR